MEIIVTDFATGQTIEELRASALLKSQSTQQSTQDTSRTEESHGGRSPLEALARMQYGTDQSIKSRLQQYFLENTKSSLRIRLFNFIIKVISCILYCVRVIQDSGKLPEHVKLDNASDIHYEKILWVGADEGLWLVQTIVAIISISETVLIFYLTYKGSIFRLLFNIHFLLELSTGAPLIFSIFVPIYRHFYVPIFLNCWLANSILDDMLHDFHRVSQVNHSALMRQMVGLLSVLTCLLFSGACGIEHLQRSGERQFDLFMSLYFVIVTMSTVGYGDLHPDWWMSRLYVIILICVAFCVLPSKIEALSQTWKEREKAGMDYTKGFARGEKHVVVTITHLDADFIADFLNEFYAHPKHAGYLIVLLSPSELDNRMKLLLKIPLWSHRVLYVRGSALKDDDLDRAQMAAARACFILSARYIQKKSDSDEQTILRSWAVKDFSPHVPQYVQVFRPETKMHIEHAETVICEDEFKYSLLANNCICPGISTFITLLMHTSRGEEGQKSTEPWHKVYGFHSGNEIYDVVAGDSRFFGDFVGRSFSYASFYAHEMYGVNLLGVKRSDPGEQITLNPGHHHIIQPTDRFYYVALTNEESLPSSKKSAMKILNQSGKHIAHRKLQMPSGGHDAEKHAKLKVWRKRRMMLKKSKGLQSDAENLIGDELQKPPEQSSRKSSVGVVTGEVDLSSSSDEECDVCGVEGCLSEKIVKTYPPISSYIGTSATVCHTMKTKRDYCCLQIDKPCQHDNFNNPGQYGWKNPAIIVAVDKTSSGLYNLILPLRAYYRPVHELQPIILLLELEDDKLPSATFLDVIAWFPMIYWMQGKISSLDNLLKAGICLAEHVIVCKEGAMATEEFLADCSTILTVQKIHRMFPKLRIITELTHASNMRFMQFDACDVYALQQGKFEKRERKRGSPMPYMFRLPFAQGGVFSANMLDRLLYQAIVKDYLVGFLKILLGIEQTPGSGYLAAIQITEDDMWIRTYGRLYQKLCASVGDIPIGIYRTKLMDCKTISIEVEAPTTSGSALAPNTSYPNAPGARSQQIISDLVKARMQTLGMPAGDYEHRQRERKTLSYVIINPPREMELENGDIIYVLRAPVKEDARNNRINPRRGLRRGQPKISDHANLLTAYPDDRSVSVNSVK
uniref:Potassium channel subfamily T member 2 n=1 Tax=Panagrellus redivivus TaxID=6233 RepID=A0A7E4ZRB9_PANRE